MPITRLREDDERRLCSSRLDVGGTTIGAALREQTSRVGRAVKTIEH